MTPSTTRHLPRRLLLSLYLASPAMLGDSQDDEYHGPDHSLVLSSRPNEKLRSLINQIAIELLDAVFDVGGWSTTLSSMVQRLQ